MYEKHKMVLIDKTFLESLDLINGNDNCRAVYHKLTEFIFELNKLGEQIEHYAYLEQDPLFKTDDQDIKKMFTYRKNSVTKEYNALHVHVVKQVDKLHLLLEIEEMASMFVSEPYFCEPVARTVGDKFEVMLMHEAGLRKYTLIYEAHMFYNRMMEDNKKAIRSSISRGVNINTALNGCYYTADRLQETQLELDELMLDEWLYKKPNLGSRLLGAFYGNK